MVAFPRGVFGGALLPQPKTVKARPEPQGRGQRVVLQRINGLTAPGVLERPFLFQCTPINEFPVQSAWDYIDFDTVGDGYRSRPGSSQLVQVSFDTLFVDDPNMPFVVNKARPWNPLELVAELKAIGDARTPFQLIAGQPDLWGIYYDVNMVATLRSLRSSEQAGERDARYVTVSFYEFKGVTPAAISQALLSAGTNQNDSSAIAVLNVADLSSGTTLRDLSQRFYGTTTLWSVIAKASGISAPGSVDLVAWFASTPTPPKIVVPAPAIAKAAGR